MEVYDISLDVCQIALKGLWEHTKSSEAANRLFSARSHEHKLKSPCRYRVTNPLPAVGGSIYTYETRLKGVTELVINKDLFRQVLILHSGSYLNSTPDWQVNGRTESSQVPGASNFRQV